MGIDLEVAIRMEVDALHTKTSIHRGSLRAFPLKVKANSYLSKPFLFFLLATAQLREAGSDQSDRKIFSFPLDISGNCDILSQ